MDKASAWAELARFAEACDVEMDERSHPDYVAETDDTDEEMEADEESEVADYDELVKALRTGHISLDESSVMTVHWKCPPRSDATMVLDPRDWEFSRAYRAMTSVSVAPPVSKSARKRNTTDTDDDRIGRLDTCLEILGKQPKDTLIRIKRRADRDLCSFLTKFITLE